VKVKVRHTVASIIDMDSSNICGQIWNYYRLLQRDPHKFKLLRQVGWYKGRSSGLLRLAGVHYVTYNLSNRVAVCTHTVYD
jgi:hypothetical protein